MKKTLILLLLAAAQLIGAGLPTPEAYFGHRMGADRKLVSWDGVVSYFEKLEAGSDKIRVDTVGRSTGDLPFIAAIISAPETLGDLDRYRRIQERLADPRTTSPAEAEGLVAEGKSVVMITCSIHSTEVASTHTAIEFAHRLLTGDTPKIRAILENTIFILVPSLNPDGVEIVREWYEETLGTEFEGTSPPELYQKYLGHDNNRDWYIFSQQETRVAISQLHNVWHPQIVYDVHQQGVTASRMFLPPWMDPIDPNIDPILAQLCNMIGTGMAADLTSAGKKGVLINASYDFWTPARHYQAYHGGMRILSETASVKVATPVVVSPDEIPRTGRGYNPRESSWNYLEPWLGGKWTLRDIVDYQLIAWESCLFQAAARREDLLRSFYKIGQRAVSRTTPYAFLIPASQHDPGSARKMLDTLAFGMVDVEQATRAFEADGKRYPADTYVIRMKQPYSSFAKTLLERQDYPDLRQYPGGPPKRPYDVTAHTLPLLMGVETVEVEEPFEASLERVDEFEFSVGGRRAAAGGYEAANIESWKDVNRIWREGGSILRDQLTGDFYTSKLRNMDLEPLPKPRIGLYRSFVPSMDEGWTRWLLEQFGFEYESVQNPAILRGNLRRSLDVIVFPDQRTSTLRNGYRKGSMPERLTGGLNDRCVAALKAFVAEGGTLVFINGSTEFALQHLNVRARNVVKDVDSSDYYVPGSLLNVRLARHPLTFGLPREITIWSQQSPAFETGKPNGAKAVASYEQSGILASGWLLGEGYLSRRAALLEVPSGRGRIILFGMRPQYRAQSYQTAKLFFNALMRY